MYVVISRFTVADRGMVPFVREAFRDRPHLVDEAPGFVRMEVMSPTDAPEEVWLMTWWQDEADFRAWHRSHAYHASHERMPKGLRLTPKSTSIRSFELFAR